MKLIHLGASYTPSIMELETVETDTELTFLGRSFKMRAAKVAPPKFPQGYLTYRGARYKA
ncbi:MAG: DUF4278 domain-containing protein [Leptolyngbyaceae cyanobacterium MAG.088]|nr:DUF4278 domain-containing protein [Leptolyngbyaceae cyanobacterium MAG.088]